MGDEELDGHPFFDQLKKTLGSSFDALTKKVR